MPAPSPPCSPKPVTQAQRAAGSHVEPFWALAGARHRGEPLGDGATSKQSRWCQCNSKPRYPADGVMGNEGQAGPPPPSSPNPTVSGELCLHSCMSLQDGFRRAAQSRGLPLRMLKASCAPGEGGAWRPLGPLAPVFHPSSPCDLPCLLLVSELVPTFPGSGWQVLGSTCTSRPSLPLPACRGPGDATPPHP